MANKQYTMEFRMAAKLDGTFLEALNSAKSQFSELESKLQELEKQTSNTSGYQQQAQAVQSLGQKLQELDTQYSAVKDRFAELQTAWEDNQKAQKLIETYEKQTKAISNTEEQIQLLEYQYKELEKKTEEAGDSTDAWQKKLANLNTKIENAYQTYQKQEQALEETTDAMNKAGISTEDLAAESDRLESEAKELTEGFKDLSAEMQTSADRTDKLEQEMSELAGSFQNVGQTDAYADDELRKLKDSMEEYDSEQQKAREATEQFNSATQELYTGALRKLGEQLVTLAESGLTAVADQFKAAVDAAIEFESAITGVDKTTDMSAQELADYADAIQEMASEIPVTTTELAGISEIAGQLGIANDDLLDFTETMAMLSTATTMTAEEGATLAAQFANITQMDTSEYSNLGSTIVDLGNNYATTEERILSIMQSMAASASLAGMTEAEMAGISTAVSSLGINVQAGGTALQTLITDMLNVVETGEDLDAWANVANMTAEEFTELWGTDAASALTAFITGLSDTERLGQSASVTLNELGITEKRLTRTILSLSNSGDLLTNAISDANAAWEENTALQEEAEKRYATTESQLTLLSNAWNNLKITIGDTTTGTLARAASWLTDVIEDIDGAIQGTTTAAEEYDEAIENMANATAYLAAYDQYQQIQESIELAVHYGATVEDLKDQEDALAAVQQQLIDLSGGLITATAEETAEYEAQAEAVKYLYEVQNNDNLQDTREYLIENASSYTEALENIERAERDAATAQSDQASLIDEQTAAREKYNAANNAYIALQTEVSNGLLDTTEGVRQYEEELNNLESLYAQATGENLEFSNLAEAQTYFDELQDIVDAADQAVADNEDYINNQIPDYIEQEEARAESYMDRLLDYIEQGGATAEEAAQMFGVPIENITDTVAEMVYTSGADLETAAETYGISLEDLQTAVEGMEEATEAETKALEENAEQTELTQTRAQELLEDEDALTEAMDTMAAGVMDGSYSLEAARGYMASLGDTTSENVQLLEAFDSAMTDALEELWGMEAAEYAEQQITSVTDALDDLIKTYNETKEAISENVGFFEDMTIDSDDKTSVSEMIKLLETEQSYMANYQANLEKAQNLGISQSLLDNLLDGSQDSAIYLEAIANSNADTVARLNEEWAETEEMREEWSTNLTDMTEDWDTAMEEILDDLPEIIEELNQSSEAAAAGKDTMLAYAEALSDNISSVESAAKAAAQAAASAFSINFTVSAAVSSSSVSSTSSDGSTYYYETGTNNGTTAAKAAAQAAVSAQKTVSALEAAGFATHAEGGILTEPHLGMVAEDGAEAVIPLTDRARGLEVWQEAGEYLGVEPVNLPVSGSGSYSEGDSIVITLSPQYNISGSTDAAGVQQALTENNKNLKKLIENTVNQMQKQKLRRSYV